ncbi:putative lipoprotein (plasmid) [Cupriavidus neocaledonicus]|uniref:Lipoprotein n=1 Tax=Cupriavidus neocaledonicus TaxID=1040979 RepID=A0A375HWT2_9BURK|nr:putative lipoprotein [Cupriavidus neocaledonicus]SPD61130.1 putative lipoprotein [Cupriavidus neocaledonicus]
MNLSRSLAHGALLLGGWLAIGTSSLAAAAIVAQTLA